MADPHIIEERREGVAVLRMQRPEKKNSLTAAMYNALREGIERADQDPAIGAVVITGTDDCFTAGNDLHDFQAAAMAETPMERSRALEMIEAIARSEVPVIAAVNGIAIGIGTTLLLHCDFVYAGTSAVFRTPFVDLGLCPEAASSLLLPLIIGPRRASEMLLGGMPLDAEQARDCGLVNSVHADEQTLSAALAQAANLARKPREAVRLSKRLMREHWQANILQTMAEERREFGQRLQSDDCKAALAAFFGRTQK